MNIHNENTLDFCRTTATELSKLFATKELSPVEVTECVLGQAEGVNNKFNAFTLIDYDGAIKAAKESEKRWLIGKPLSPVDGVPSTIKDMVHCGLDARYGSLVTSDVSGMPDSPSAKNLRDAGTVILGLTTTPEFGWKAVTDSPRNGVTCNPWDVSKTSGGSSGGAAVAAAAGIGALHLGTDGGGSIRIPASFCGIVGHKPTFGRVPAYPASAFGTVAHIGPMARTVGDTALMLNAMSGRDLRDWNQSITPPSDVNPRNLDLTGMKVGYWREPSIGKVDPEIDMIVQHSIQDFEQAGANIEIISLPQQSELLEIFNRHWLVGANNRLSDIDTSKHDLLDPGFLDAAKTGAKYTAVERMQAEIARSDYGVQMDALLEEYDFLLSPTLPIAPFEAGVNVPQGSDFKTWLEWSGFSFPINLSQQPACSVPCGKTKDGLPVGLQIIGARGDDEGVLSVALTYENMHPDRFLFADGQWPSY